MDKHNVFYNHTFLCTCTCALTTCALITSALTTCALTTCAHFCARVNFSKDNFFSLIYTSMQMNWQDYNYKHENQWYNYNQTYDIHNKYISNLFTAGLNLTWYLSDQATHTNIGIRYYRWYFVLGLKYLFSQINISIIIFRARFTFFTHIFTVSSIRPISEIERAIPAKFTCKVSEVENYSMLPSVRFQPGRCPRN